MDEEDLFLSVITTGEIQKGITRLKDLKRRNQLQKWLDRDLQQRFGERILSFDAEAAQEWGLILARAEAAGKSMPVLDAQIAAIARVHHLTVVTRNVRDLLLSGVEVMNPWES